MRMLGRQEAKLKKQTEIQRYHGKKIPNLFKHEKHEEIPHTL